MNLLLEGSYANPILLHLRLSSEDSIRYYVFRTYHWRNRPLSCPTALVLAENSSLSMTADYHILTSLGNTLTVSPGQQA